MEINSIFPFSFSLSLSLSLFVATNLTPHQSDFHYELTAQARNGQTEGKKERSSRREKK
jgi:hypothetical protein